MGILYTIGYSNFSPIDTNDFIRFLKSNNIKVVCDIRSVAFSNYFKIYNTIPLSLDLKKVDIKHEVLGPLLGVAKIKETLEEGGEKYLLQNVVQQINFNAYLKASPIKTGFEIIKNYLENENVLLLCSEKMPETCHRSSFITYPLWLEGQYQINHILSDFSQITQEDLNNKVSRIYTNDFFGAMMNKNERINYAWSLVGNGLLAGKKVQKINQ